MIEIRPLRPDEVERAHAIEARSYPAAEAASLERFRDRQARFPDGFLVLLEDGEIRSLLCAVRTRAADLADEAIKAEGGDDPAGSDLVILSVATDPPHRRRGLAALLLAAIAREAERRGIARIRLLCKADRVGFYARQGYRYVGVSRCRHGGAVWHEMERAPGLAGLRADGGRAPGT
jgi:GNAT superfamily N-acetyltransferase